MVLVVFGGAAWLVIKSMDTSNSGTPASESSAAESDTQDKSKSSSETTAYSDEFIAFSYPSDWEVERQYTFTDPYNALSILIRAPIDSTLKAADPSSKDLQLVATVLLAKNEQFGRICEGCGKVYSVEPVTTSDGGTGNFIIAESGVPGQPSSIDLTYEPVAVDDESYIPSGIKVGSAYTVRVYGSYNSSNISQIGFTEVNSIKESVQYAQLRQLVESIKVQANKLP